MTVPNQCKKNGKIKPALLCCGCLGGCGSRFWLNEDSEILNINLSDDDNSELTECVVEKLIIKRLSLRKFVSEQELKDLNARQIIADRNLAPSAESPPHSQNVHNSSKSILTFSSYYKTAPPIVAPPNPVSFEPPTKHITAELHNYDISVKAPSPITPPPPSPATIKLSFPDRQIPNKTQTIAKVHQHPFPTQKMAFPRPPQLMKLPRRHNVLFTKPKSPKNDIPKIIDPAIEETLQIIADKESKRPIANRKTVHRDPKTGKVTHVFKKKNALSDQELFKLNDLLYIDRKLLKNDEKEKSKDILSETPLVAHIDNSTSSLLCEAESEEIKRIEKKESVDADLESDQPQSGLKWKIIIKHHEDKATSNDSSPSSVVPTPLTNTPSSSESGYTDSE